MVWGALRFVKQPKHIRRLPGRLERWVAEQDAKEKQGAVRREEGAKGPGG